MKDILGKAMLDRQLGKMKANPVTSTSISEADELEIDYLFRKFAQMPRIEQEAMHFAKGRILDAGCGAGSHSLELQSRGLDVTSIDISPLAIETARLRGVQNAMTADIMEVREKYDTILLLMNGTGICGTLENLPGFLTKLRTLLSPGGQILIDSSDIIYMFEDEDGGYSIPAQGFYGELTFYLNYDGEDEDPFPWLYVPFNLLAEHASAAGLNCEKILDGPHYDYLARLSVK